MSTGKPGRPVGLRKTGGRGPGTPNRRTLEVAEKLDALGCDPLAILAAISLSEESPIDARIRCAIELSGLLYLKRRAIDIDSDQEQKYKLKTVIENAASASSDHNDPTGT